MKGKTKVYFLIHTDETEPNDLFAYFPEETAHDQYKTCYAHIGQHSACHPDYASESRNATPNEYDNLRTELESIGYNLEIARMPRFSPEYSEIIERA